MATVSIQVPMLETKLPVQTVAKARCRNGRNGDTRVGWTGLVTRPGYPGRARPALPRPLLQSGPERLAPLDDAAEPAGALAEVSPGRARPPRARRRGAGPRGPAGRPWRLRAFAPPSFGPRLRRGRRRSCRAARAGRRRPGPG